MDEEREVKSMSNDWFGWIGKSRAICGGCGGVQVKACISLSLSLSIHFQFMFKFNVPFVHFHSLIARSRISAKKYRSKLA
jgi:hypothetical protein